MQARDDKSPVQPHRKTNGETHETPSPSDRAAVEKEIVRLSRLTPLEFELQRKAAAKSAGLGVVALDRLVTAERRKAEAAIYEAAGQGRPIEFREIERWAEPVEGEALLTNAARIVHEYVVVSDEQADALALWAIYTHVFALFDHTPRLFLTSPEMSSGKTRAVLVLRRMVARAYLVSAAISPACLRYVIEAHHPTLLLDEMDALLKGPKEMVQMLRGILNAGFNREDANVPALVPTPDGGWEPRNFSVFCAQVYSGIGDVPATTRSRSIVIEMKRKLPNETIKRLRECDGADLHIVQRMAARWAFDNADALRAAEPANIPGELNDRAADAWEPLLMIANLAGGAWPERACRAACALSGARATTAETTGTMMLADIRQAFAEKVVDRLSSGEMAQYLAGLDGRPWSEWNNGKGISKGQLSRTLAMKWKLSSRSIRLPGGGQTQKGYHRDDFTEVFQRWLPPEPPTQNGTTAHTEQAFEKAAISADPKMAQDETCAVSANRQKPDDDGRCAAVPFSNRGDGQKCEIETDDALAERAAILEIEGGLSREDAGRVARDEELLE
jgi:putative DNA primase/helicase